MRLTGFLLGCVASLGIMAGAAAQTSYPERPIRLVVPFPPGGGTDTISRNVADKLGRANGWVISIDNKPGAGGIVGLSDLANAPADGYSIGMGQTSNLAINPAAMPSIPFNAQTAFKPVALVAEIPLVLVVRADSPIKTMEDLVKLAKSSKEPIKQAVPGVGTMGHLAGEMLALRAGYPVLIVPYKGASPAISDLLGGQTDFMLSTPQGAIGLVNSGKLRAIAVTSASRVPALSQVPTVAESGYPGFIAIDWKGVVAPAGTPDAIVEKLNKAINEALKDKDLLEQLNREASLPMGGSVAQAATFIKKEQADWAKVIKDINFKL